MTMTTWLFLVVLSICLKATSAWVPPVVTYITTPIVRSTSSSSSVSRQRYTPASRRRDPTISTTLVAASTTALAAVKSDEDLLPIVREGIADKDATDEWNQCVDFLEQDLSISSQQSEILLAAALEWRGWARVTSALARKYMSPKLPNLHQLQTAMKWLREGPLELTDNVLLLDAIEQSPKVYLVDPETAYHQALATAPSKYKNADTFKNLLLDDPSVLQCSYNCADEGCNSECGNCWVSYEMKRG